MTLKTIDNPVEWVRAHPERFFKTGAANELELAQSVWMDATLFGARDVLVHHEAGVWVIAGSTDWFVERTLSPAELFVRVVPLSAAGPNSMRSEILLNVFCSEVVAIISGTTVFTKGAGTVRSVVDQIFQRWPPLEVGVGFRM